MKLLLMSKRVTDDLVQALEAEEGFDEAFDLRLVVRQWCDGIREDGEFRGCLNARGQLVALSQYNEFFYQPDLAESAAIRTRVVQNLTRFVAERVRQALPSKFFPCICDFCILQKSLHAPFNPDGEIQVVELNPANERTSTALFRTDEALAWLREGVDGTADDAAAFREFRVAGKLGTDDGRFLQEQLNKAQWRWKALQLWKA